MLIDFREIPGTSNLFADFLNDFEKVQSYYGVNFRDIDNYESVFKSIVESQNQNKADVTKIIESFYSNFNPSNKMVIYWQSL